MTPGPDGGGGFFRGLLAGAIIAVLLLATISPLRELVFGEGASTERVDDAIDVIESSYFRETEPADLEDASIEGMIRRLRREHEDRFSHYFDAETFKRFEAATSGEFSGIGTTVSEVKAGLRIARVFEGTPAEDAELEIGDVIVAVDGESIAGVPSDEAAALIQGPPGTEVELTLVDGDDRGRPERGKKRNERDVTLERAEVKIPAVEGRIVRQDGEKLAFVQLATFSSGAHGELRAEIDNLTEQGARGVILDLRGNGGGLLREAVLVTSIFQEDGPVVTTEGRTRPEETLDVTGKALPERPMAVLTNRDTASASEIVAASLEQNGIATIVGTRTFGKGTFQEIIELDGGAALDLTVGEYLTSDGSSILGKGVKPTVKVADDDPADGDAVLDRAKKLLARELQED